MDDPFHKLKFIAYCRSALPPAEFEKVNQTMVDYAKWAICKSRNILFLDPVWDNYGDEDIFIEYFTIIFDENEKARTDFLSALRGISTDHNDWFNEMEEKYVKEQEQKMSEAMGPTGEINDSFGSIK